MLIYDHRRPTPLALRMGIHVNHMKGAIRTTQQASHQKTSKWAVGWFKKTQQTHFWNGRKEGKVQVRKNFRKSIGRMLRLLSSRGSRNFDWGTTEHFLYPYPKVVSFLPHKLSPSSYTKMSLERFPWKIRPCHICWLSDRFGFQICKKWFPTVGWYTPSVPRDLVL